MAQVRKLAVFDIDGTIATNGVVPSEIIDGFRHLHTLGYMTTVSTGRTYSSVRRALGIHFDTLISEEALSIIEHGTKMVHRDGRVVQADYFTDREKDHFVDFIRVNADMLTLVRYATPDPAAPLQVWVKDPTDIEEIRKLQGAYADVFTCSFEDLRARLALHDISHILARLQEFITVTNLKLHFTRSGMDLMFLDGYMQFVGNLSDKAKAIRYLEKFHEIKVEDMLVAGNGINDVDMINLPAGTRMFVGDTPSAQMVLSYLRDIDEVVRVSSPEHLGEYLQTLK